MSKDNPRFVVAVEQDSRVVGDTVTGLGYAAISESEAKSFCNRLNELQDKIEELEERLESVY